MKVDHEARCANDQKKNPRPFEIAAGWNEQPRSTVQTEIGFKRIGSLTFRTC